MKIIQITDLHIGREGELPVGLDVRGNFAAILEKAAAMKPDYLVLSGDLSFHDGDPEACEWVRSLVVPLGIPFEVIPGNHDDPAGLARIFGYEKEDFHQGELYFFRKWGPQTVLFLDTSRGEMSSVQWQWLETQLAGWDSPLALIFMHHPPVPAGVPFMDQKYPFLQIQAFERLVQKYPLSYQVFCGHYHVEKTVAHRNGNVFITPSTFFQIAQHTDALAIDHTRPAFRAIDLQENGDLFTTVAYI